MTFKVVPQRDRKLHRLLRRGATRALPRGGLLYRAREPAEDVFHVQSGSVLLLRGEREEEQVLELVGPGELFGEEALDRAGRRRTDARGAERTILTVLPGSEVFRALGSSERTLEAFLHAKEERLALLRELGEPRGRGGGASSRVARVILDLGSRFGKEEPGGLLLRIRTTHRLLGDLAGVHRSTVTTLLNEWAYEGLLEVRGRGLLLRDPGRFARVAGGSGTAASVDLPRCQR